MWEAGGVHGSHEALLLQAAGSGAGGDYGHAGPALLPPWLGPAAAPGFSYMAPHHQGPAFGAEAAAGAFGFGGGYGGDGGGAGQLGVFGLEPPLPPPPHGLLAAAAGGGGALPQGSSRMVSGLLGTLQAELGRMTAKEIMDAKALAASRSHSEAERRRRQRINSHLARLRSLLPNTTKTDKASLLAKVIEHVKELKRQTSAVLGAAGEGEGEEAAARQHLLLPTESDELAVDAGKDGEGRLVVRASLCCEDRAGLIPDIARALAALRLRARRAEIATLGGRVRNVLLITTADDDEDEEGHGGQGDDDDEDGGDGGDAAAADGCARASSHHRRHELVASIQEALRGVMDRKTASSDTSSSSGGGSIKRQRMSGAHEQGSL
ncbi:transcription factor bHLH30-like [Panicum miliaceum]|uniref:Transcription factor bHLH30-like n=1 Tax=Panicum miliaceum TaxID=4540 RepID=A0A3L6RK28_PANMI|nr:transcription factor bHLH30-like [Panicum miliaceum]